MNTDETSIQNKMSKTKTKPLIILQEDSLFIYVHHKAYILKSFNLTYKNIIHNY